MNNKPVVTPKKWNPYDRLTFIEWLDEIAGLSLDDVDDMDDDAYYDLAKQYNAYFWEGASEADKNTEKVLVPDPDNEGAYMLVPCMQ